MIKSKRMTSKSGITIPKDLRADSGFFPGMAVDLETVKGGVLIRPHVPVCRFCGRPDGVKEVARMNMCPACRATLKKELDSSGD